MDQVAMMGIGLHVSDVSGQRAHDLRGVPVDVTVGELMQSLLSRMKLPQNDAEGRPLTYHARLEREGRHLHTSEVVGHALQDEDRIVLQPNIDAGGWRR